MISGQQRLLLSSRRLWYAAGISAVFFTVLAAAVITDRVSAFDALLIGWIQEWNPQWLTEIAIRLTDLGTFWASAVIGLIVTSLLAVSNRWREVLLFLVVVLGSQIGNLILKNLFRRVRPDDLRIIEVTGYSFPSGHSMAAMSLYGMLAWILWRHLPHAAGKLSALAGCAVLVLGIGWSRIYLGVHYPSDIIGGYAASLAWLTLLLGIYERLLTR